MSVGFTINGLGQMKKRVQILAEEMPEKVGRALRAEMRIEMKTAHDRTPEDTGALKDSYVLGPIEYWGKHVRVGIMVGGVSKKGIPVPYAIYVHEILDAIHPVGEAKFLERTLRESRPFMAERVARRLEKELKK